MEWYCKVDRKALFRKRCHIMYGIGFYDEYLNRMGNLIDQKEKSTQYKIDYLKSIIKNDKVYKFVSFADNAQIKLETFLEDKIWFSFYKTLNDDTEVKFDYKIKKVVNHTGLDRNQIDRVVNYFIQMNDVFSLTYEYKEYMWTEYAANGNGMCVEYNVENYDYLYPVVYCDKKSIDFTKMVIRAMKNTRNSDCAIAIIPWVLKNSYNNSSMLDSTREKEVRILHCPFDDSEINDGIVDKDIKERMGYKGIAEKYYNHGLSISKIIIGDKCYDEVKYKLLEYAKRKQIDYSIW